MVDGSDSGSSNQPKEDKLDASNSSSVASSNEQAKITNIDSPKIVQNNIVTGGKKGLRISKRVYLVVLLIFVLILAGGIYVMTRPIKTTVVEVSKEEIAREAGTKLLSDYEQRKQKFKEETKTPQQNLTQLQDELKKAEDNNDESAKASVYTKLAFAAKEAGETQLAKEYAKKALPYFQGLNNDAKAMQSGLILNLEKLANA